MIKVAVCGALGKMGTEVVQAVKDCSDTELAAQIDIAGAEFKSIEEAHKACDIDVLVDFTQPKSIFENAKYCLNNGIKIVIGTTGLKDEEKYRVFDCSEFFNRCSFNDDVCASGIKVF